jgi:16S rRNA (guanine966-N2)-methyltransferase
MRIVGGKYRGKKILSPLSEGTRPTSDRTREMIFNVLLHNPAFGPSVILDKAVLDVFAGTGALGLEALSRGAQSVTFIENDQSALSTLRLNTKDFEGSSTRILEKEAQHLGQAPSSFDLIFLDPHYEKNLILPTLAQLSSHGWFSPEAIIVIEMGKTEAFSSLPFLSFTTERISGISKIIFSKYIKI